MKYSLLLALAAVKAEELPDDTVLLKDVQKVPVPDMKLDNSVILKEKEDAPEVPVEDAEEAYVNSFGYCVNSRTK